MNVEFRRPRFADLVLLSAVILMAGCSNPLVLPSTGRLERSKIYADTYPYTLIIEGYQEIRFNVHTFEFGNDKVKETFEIFLKKDTGTLTDGDFAVCSFGGILPIPSRGSIVIQNNEVLINVEVRQVDTIGKSLEAGWVKSRLNGKYRVVRDAVKK